MDIFQKYFLINIFIMLIIYFLMIKNYINYEHLSYEKFKIKNNIFIINNFFIN